MIKKILKIIIWIILIILLLLSIYSIVSKVILKKKYINIFGYSYLTVKSNSMFPAIKINDLLIIKITKDIKEKDIITYESDGVLITHRVESIKEKEIITKGDFNNTTDDPISMDSVIGKVIKII